MILNCMNYRVTINSPLAVPDFIRYLENDFEGPELSTAGALPIHRYFAGSIALHQTTGIGTDPYTDVFDFGSRFFRQNTDNNECIDRQQHEYQNKHRHER